MKDYDKFTKIGQFKDLIHSQKARCQYIGTDANGVAQYDTQIPITGKLHLEGTVKLHGTSCSLTYDAATDALTFGSRNFQLSPSAKDRHYGFIDWVLKNEVALCNKLRDYCQGGLTYEKLTVFGEWCGSGVQRNVSISQLPKAFYAFAIKAVLTPHTDCTDSAHDVLQSQESQYLPSSLLPFLLSTPAIGFYNITDFPTYELVVDLENPKTAVDLANKLVYDVAEKCPVASQLGVDGFGEGIVFRSIDSDTDIFVKVKGTRHSSSGGKKSASIDPMVAKSIDDFIDKTVTQDRCEQGWTLLKQSTGFVSKVNTGTFVKWLINDVMTEEGDALEFNSLRKEQVLGPLSKAAGTWFIKELDNDL